MELEQYAILNLMELLAIVLLWPLLILTLGVVVLSGYDLGGTSLVLPIVIVFFILAFGMRERLGNTNTSSESENLDAFRRGIVAFSIVFLLPLWVTSLLEALNNCL